MHRALTSILLMLAGCGSEPVCGTDVVNVARDIGTARYAVTEVRNCGATTDYATIVRVGRASESQANAQEVFVGDSDHGAATPGGRNAIWTRVVWTAPGQLLINYALRARTFKRLSRAEGASIRFRATEPIAVVPAP